MPNFEGAISGLRALRNEVRGATEELRTFAASSSETRAVMDATAEHASRFASGVVSTMDRLKEETTPRIKDLEFDLERMSEQGNAWATSLLDIVRQVQAGTVDAGKAIESMGDGMILFEGKLRSVKDVLLDVLPTTGEVQAGIIALREELEHADISELVDRLKGQYNEYAQLFADTVEGFAAGKVTLERVLQLAQQLQQVLPGSETAALADAIADGLAGGTL